MTNYTREEIREHAKRCRLRKKARRGESTGLTDKELRDLLEFDARRENRFRDQVANKKAVAKRKKERQEKSKKRKDQKAAEAAAKIQRRKEEKDAKQRWEELHPNEVRERRLERQRASRGEKIIINAKKGPCTDCGKKFPPYVMDLHHVRGKKAANISQMKRGSVKKLEEEIAKCDLLCANCHRIRHYSKFWKSLDESPPNSMPFAKDIG